MANDTTYNVFQHYGTHAERLAFPNAPAAGTQPIYIWYETDTDEVWLYYTTWTKIANPGGASTVEVDVYGALYGDGSVAYPLGVNVDNATIIINGSNQLEAVAGSSGIVVAAAGALDGDGTGGDPLAVLVDGITALITANNINVGWRKAGTTATTGTTGTGSWVYSSNVSEVIFTGLAGFTEIMLELRNITGGASITRDIQVSIDNGANWLSGASDYEYIDGNGVLTTATALGTSGAASASARSGLVIFHAWNSADIKGVSVVNRSSGTQANFIPTANALNAVRIFASSNNFTGGMIKVYGR